MASSAWRRFFSGSLSVRSSRRRKPRSPSAGADSAYAEMTDSKKCCRLGGPAYHKLALNFAGQSVSSRAPHTPALLRSWCSFSYLHRAVQFAPQPGTRRPSCRFAAPGTVVSSARRAAAPTTPAAVSLSAVGESVFDSLANLYAPDFTGNPGELTPGADAPASAIRRAFAMAMARERASLVLAWA